MPVRNRAALDEAVGGWLARTGQEPRPMALLTISHVANGSYPTFSFQFILLPVHSLANSFSCQFILLPVHSLANSFSCQFILLPIHSPANSFSCQFILLPIHSLANSLWRGRARRPVPRSDSQPRLTRTGLTHHSLAPQFSCQIISRLVSCPDNNSHQHSVRAGFTSGFRSAYRCSIRRHPLPAPCSAAW